MSARGIAIALAAAALAAAACRHETNLHRPPPGAKPAPPPRLEHKRTIDKETGRVVRDGSRLVYPDRPPAKHGKETVWYPSGGKHWEREYAEGRPFGAWRSWYENGNPRSESFFGAPDVDTQMTFWHPNGQVSLRGPARNGNRRGVWTVWYEDGRIAEQGPFSGSRREGRWIAWSKDGKQRYERIYAKNVRISERLLEGDADAGAAAVAAPVVTEPDEDERPPK